MEIIGKIEHYPRNGEVSFEFVKDHKEGELVPFGFSLPFEIWKKFKNNTVKITVEKVEGE